MSFSQEERLDLLDCIMSDNEADNNSGSEDGNMSQDDVVDGEALKLNLWEHVVQYKTQCKCLYCGVVLNTCVSGTQRRLRALKPHFLDHPGKKGNILFKKCTQFGRDNTSAAVQSQSSLSSLTHTVSSSQPTKKRKGPIDGFLVRDLTVVEQERWEEAIAYYFYVTGTPFSRAGHFALLEALQLLRPNVRMPHRDKIGGILLDKCYEKTKSKVADVVAKAGKIVCF